MIDLIRLYLISLFWTQILSLNQICDLNQNQCVPGSVFYCDSAECTLYCDGSNACFDIEFNCDDTYVHNECVVTCATSHSCAQTTILSNRDTKLQCLTYQSCITNSTFLEVTNDDDLTQIYANITIQYENIIDDNYPNIYCEGVNYCATHCIGSSSQCQTYPQYNPLCNFIDGDYDCSISIVAPNDNYNDKLIVGQLFDFHDNRNYMINNINIAFTVTDTSWNANFIKNLEFYIIETSSDININYTNILSFCNTHNYSQFTHVFASSQHTYTQITHHFRTVISNITFIFEKGQVIINENNNGNNFAWILLFGCKFNADHDIATVYTQSMTLQTHSVFSGHANNGHFVGISSVADYDGTVGFPNGYDFKFSVDFTASNQSTTSMAASLHNVLKYDSTVTSIANIIMYAFVGLCVLLAFVGWCYSWYSGADNVNVFSVILFGIYGFDFYADIVFAIALAIIEEYELFLASCMFIVIPFVLNFATLFRSHTKWITDASIQYKVSEWYLHYNLLLMTLTFVSGSAFAAVELCNCNLFPLEMFSMGLTARHIKKFSNKRLYSTVLLENVPQIALQIYFTVWVLGQAKEIVILAFVTSILSICFSIIDIYSTKRMFKTIKQAGMQQLYYIEIGGHEIESKKKILLQKPNAIKLVFAEISGLDPRSVNIILCCAIQGGIRIAFEVHSQIFLHKSSVEMLQILRTSIHNLAQSIQRAWKLDQIPNIEKIDLVGDDEKNQKMGSADHKNTNFSIQAKRSSILSNRFFSLDINGRNKSNPNSINLQIQIQQQQNLRPGNAGISLKEIEKINKEKEEMDKIEGNSSYWGSSRNIHCIDMDVPLKPALIIAKHSLHLSPHNSTSSQQQSYKKNKKAKKKRKENNNFSIQVQGPSSYNKDDSIKMLELIDHRSNTDIDISVSVATDSEESTDSQDLSIEPSPNNRHHSSHSANTVNIVITSDHDTNVRPQMSNDDSIVAEPGSLQPSPRNSIIYSLNSLEDQYIKPTLEAMDSYNDTEKELNDIMMNIMVEQADNFAVTPTAKTLPPIAEDGDSKKDNVHQHRHEPEQEEAEEDTLEFGIETPTISAPGSPIVARIRHDISNNDLMSDIPSSLPPIFESNLDLNIDIDKDNDNYATPVADAEEDELEIYQSVDMNMNNINDIFDVNHNSALSSFKNPETPLMFEDDEEKQANIETDSLMNDISKDDNDNELSQKNDNNKSQNNTSSDDDNDDDNDNEEEEEIIIKVHSDTFTLAKQRLSHNIKKIPSHKLPPSPRKTIPFAISRKTLPQRPSSKTFTKSISPISKPLPHRLPPKMRIPINAQNNHNNISSTL